MPNRLQHYLHGTKHMEGAWPEGTVTDEYGDRLVVIVLLIIAAVFL